MDISATTLREQKQKNKIVPSTNEDNVYSKTTINNNSNINQNNVHQEEYDAKHYQE